MDIISTVTSADIPDPQLIQLGMGGISRCDGADYTHAPAQVMCTGHTLSLPLGCGLLQRSNFFCISSCHIILRSVSHLVDTAAPPPANRFSSFFLFVQTTFWSWIQKHPELFFCRNFEDIKALVTKGTKTQTKQIFQGRACSFTSAHYSKGNNNKTSHIFCNKPCWNFQFRRNFDIESRFKEKRCNSQKTTHTHTTIDRSHASQSIVAIDRLFWSLGVWFVFVFVCHTHHQSIHQPAALAAQPPSTPPPSPQLPPPPPPQTLQGP